MKVKLLKKIRKQYEIIYYPNGAPFYDEIIDGELIRVLDKNNEYRIKHIEINILNPKEKAISEAKEQILIWFRNEYGYNHKKRLKRTKIWYN